MGVANSRAYILAPGWFDPRALGFLKIPAFSFRHLQVEHSQFLPLFARDMVPSHSSPLSMLQLVNVSGTHKELLSSIISLHIRTDVLILEIASQVDDLVFSPVLAVNSRAGPKPQSFAWFSLECELTILVLTTLWSLLQFCLTVQSLANIQVPIRQSTVKSLGPGVSEALPSG